MATGFLSLPPELRLNVYTEVITSSLASGTPSDVAGLLFSCSTIYAEMKIDRIDKVAPLLSVAKEWSGVDPDNAQLQINLPGDYRFGKAPTEATITIPYASAWMNNIGLTQSFALELVPLFALPWSILNLSIRQATLSPLEDIVNSVSIAYILLDTIPKNEANVLVLQSIDRITLQFFISSTVQLRSDTEARFLRSIVHLIKDGMEKMRLCKGIWMQDDVMECGGRRWTVGFDFVEGLDVRGQKKLENGMWSDRG